ncbi:non-ribosomal peptide synthetase [Lysobacter enzymogenes]|uniref:non-ribosomal peptide synthetase n=1 Tax=Lysobacter enzymogenes TaxID=69 RepID=UPI00089BB324|nr:non-ribosomal peptide synthetase [Lysobacter enzymogenes]SDX84781.1 amino acid adenylation domain-containing protein [Lysobacter enzymogenes]
MNMLDPHSEPAVAGSPVASVRDDDTHALSYTQESLWLLQQIAGDDAPAYNESLAFRIDGDVDADTLERALGEVVRRHDSLRTRYAESAGGLRARVYDDAQVALARLDARGHSDGARAAAEFADHAANARFDLERGPPLRAALARTGEREWILVLAAHHIAVDGWSLGIVLAELGEHYRALRESGAPAELPSLQARYADFAASQRHTFERGGYDAGIEAAKRNLAGGADLLRLPGDRPRPARQGYRGDAVALRIARAPLAALLERCKRECASTQFGVLLSAYAVLLHRYCAQERLCIGTTVLNRADADHLDVVGCYVNTAALAFELPADARFRDVLLQANEAAIGLFEHQDVPYPKLLERLGAQHDPSHNPVFQAMLTALGPRRSLDLGDGVACRPYRTARTGAKFDLLLYLTEDRDAIELEAEFNTDLFDRATVERLLSHYAFLLEQLAAHAGAGIDAQIGRIGLLPPQERALLQGFNDTAVEYPPGDVVSLFERQAAQTPDAVAVEFGAQRLSYAELDRRANRVARRLQAQAQTGDGFVGVYMDRSAEMVIALVAVLKAGLAYVPIDPDYPGERVAYMIENSQVPLVLTQPHHLAALQALGARAQVLERWLDGAADGDDAQPPPRALNADSRCYMIYTSGSTGRPKGVVNRHGALYNRLYWMQREYGLDAGDRVLQKTPFSFDVSVWEFFWPLMFGARIVVAAPGGHRDTDYLKRAIAEHGVTTCHFVPSMLSAFLEEDALAAHCASLRRVFCSGEALPYDTVARFAAALPCTLHNLYGPTEAAIDVSYWPCTLDYPGRIVPIGRPVANTSLYVVDAHRELQPIGVPGELCIGGVQLAEGYHRRDELTEAAFVADPHAGRDGARMYRTGDLARWRADGQIEYLGRIDNQVKLRGFRIELGEIEAVARALPQLREAVVLVHERGAQRLLVAYVVADDAAAFDPVEAAAQMKRHLPDFMVPQLFVPIDAIPLSVNGKLDRKALPDPLLADASPAAPAAALAAHAQPATPAERALAQAWAEALDRPAIGVDDNFFRLGGDSILSLRIVARMRELGYALQVRDLFAHPSVRELARHLRAGGAAATNTTEAPAPRALLSAADRAALPAEVEDAWPLSALQSGMIFHSTLHPRSPVYHDIFSYHLHGRADVAMLAEAVREVVAQRPQLRSRFDLGGFDEPLQLVFAQAEPEIETQDLDGLDDAAQDAALRAWTEQEKRRPFDVEARTPLRFHLQRRGPQRLVLSLAFHHAILDGWSVALVVEQIRRAYAARLQARAPAPQPERLRYSAFIAAERAALADPEQARYWREQLATLPPLAAAASAPGESRSLAREVAPALAADLQALAERAGVPLRSALLAAHLRALDAVPTLAGGAGAATGVVVNGRPELAGAEDAVGLFLNTLPLAPPPRRADPLAALRELFEREQALLPYRHYPLPEILRAGGRAAAFAVVFNYTDFHVYRDSGDGADVRIAGADYFEQTNFPLVVHAHRDPFAGGLGLTANFDPAQAPAEAVEAYLDAWLRAAQALAAPAADAAPADHGDASPLQLRLCETIAAALGGVPVGIDESYLQRGVDSISALRIVARLKRQGLRIELQQLLAHASVRALAAALDADAGADDGEAAAAPQRRRERVGEFVLAGQPRERFAADIVAAYPTTAIQALMIREHDAEPAQARYHDVFVYHLRLPLDAGRLRASLQRAVDAHELLRTSFDTQAWPEPLQRVHARVDVAFDVSDLGALDPAAQRAAVAHWMDEEKGRGFDWSQPRLMRLHVFDRGDDGFGLGLSFHHAIIDGWSLSRLIAELVADYRADGPTAADAPASDLRYRDYVALERDSRGDRDLAELWREELRGAAFAPLPRWNATASTTDSDADARWSETKRELDPALHAALEAAAQRQGATLKQVLLAGHLIALAQVQGGDEAITCAFAGGRPEEEHGERVLGMFLNFVPARQRVAGASGAQLIAACRDAERRTLRARRYPLADIQRDQQREWIAQSAFNYTRFEAYADLAQGALERVDWFEHTHFALLANLGHDLRQHRIVLTLNADARSIGRDAVEAIADVHLAAFAALADDDGASAARVTPAMAAALSALAACA